MIRKYTNVSGSPEVKVRRQSPVIGGARFYPGSSISFNEAEWAALDDGAKRTLTVLSSTEPPVLDCEEFPDPIKVATKVVIEEPEVSDSDDIEETGEKAGESDEENSDEQSEEFTGEDVTPDDVEEEPESEEDEHPFDYDGFLTGSIKDIKAKFEASDPQPDAAKLIEAEKLGEKPRSSLIGWLKQYTG